MRFEEHDANLWDAQGAIYSLNNGKSMINLFNAIALGEIDFYHKHVIICWMIGYQAWCTVSQLCVLYLHVHITAKHSNI